MKKHLEYQKSLMNKALDLQRGMQSVQNIFGQSDPEYVKRELADYEEKYALVMTELTQHICSITGFSIVPIRTSVLKNTKEVAA